jgi:hypothetical protein
MSNNLIDVNDLIGSGATQPEFSRQESGAIQKKPGT